MQTLLFSVKTSSRHEIQGGQSNPTFEFPYFPEPLIKGFFTQSKTVHEKNLSRQSNNVSKYFFKRAIANKFKAKNFRIEYEKKNLKSKKKLKNI